MKNRTTPELIENLNRDEIFVFGSNLLGRHGKGAAKTATIKFGAIFGQTSGIQGKSYGIPTKGYNMKQVLSISEIKIHVDRFIEFAKKDYRKFLVTEIGCGLAGYEPKDIAPLFIDAIEIENIYLPKRFWNELRSVLS
jgi:hypothetical protein